MAAVMALAVVGAAGAGLGYVAAKTSLGERVSAKVGAFAKDLRGPRRSLAVEQGRVSSNLHEIRTWRLPLGRAWALAEIDGGIVFSSRHGRLGVITPDLHVVDLHLAAPMRLGELRASAFGRNPLFEMTNFRTTDLLAVPEPGGRSYSLYVAHHRYDDECVRVVVSRVRLHVTKDGLTPVSREWDQIFQSRDCIGPKSMGDYFGGSESGGRLVRLGDDRLALSTGDFNFDGVNSRRAVSMDPESDLGKIIGITLSTGRAEVIASGLRNPQGLMLSQEGVLYATSHGPRGGDELNVIRPGANYGWPIVTYGLRYANRPVNWPANPKLGRHEGYDRPLFAFVPSIGISNLIEPDPREFPNWRGDLLVTSLRLNSIYRLRIVEQRVITAEPIRMEGVRMRDVISLADGRIALASDDGDIYLLGNAELGAAPPPQVLTGLDELAPPDEGETGGINGPVRNGAVMFGLHCSQCHGLNGEVRVGPPLDGVLGRRVGGFDGYQYSQALAGRRETWTRARLRRFLREPRALYPGVAMDQPTPNDDERDQIIAFLATREAVAQGR